VTGFRFLEDAAREYEEAVVYHELQAPGLGERLVDAFEQALTLALEFPQAAAPVAGQDARWLLLRPFRVKVVYAFRQDEIIIVAVFHASRRPGYWHDRLLRLPAR
jgi:plasmid stabilization system protein ParE